MDLQIIVLLVFVATGAKGRSAVDSGPQGADAQYLFSYGVNDEKTGSNFAHQETKDGLGTKGQYRVALPDGRTQVVSYTADENGYNAVVTYEGIAVHPDDDPGELPLVQPPRRTRVRKARPAAPSLPPPVLPPPSVGPDLPLFPDQGQRVTQFLNQGPDLPLISDQGPGFPLFANQGHGRPMFAEQGPDFPLFQDQGHGFPLLQDQGLGFPFLQDQGSGLPLHPNQGGGIPLFSQQGPDFPLFSDPNNFLLGFPNHPGGFFLQDNSSPGDLGTPLRRSQPVIPRPTLVPAQSTPNFPNGFPFNSPFPPDFAGNSFPLSGPPQFPIFHPQFDQGFQQIPNNGQPGFLSQIPFIDFNDPRRPLPPIQENIDPHNVLIDIPRIHSQQPNRPTPQQDLSLFIPERDLYNPDLPFLVDNAVRFHPIPVRNQDRVTPGHFITGPPFGVTPLPPPITPLPSPAPHHVTTIRHHGTPNPQHFSFSSRPPSRPFQQPIGHHEEALIPHHSTTILPPVTFRAQHGIPVRGTSFTHHLSAPHHGETVHQINEFTTLGTPVPHRGSPAPFHGPPLPLPPPPHRPHHHVTPLPQFNTILPPQGTPIPTSAIPFIQHGTPFPSTPAPLHGSHVFNQSPPSPIPISAIPFIQHGTPFPSTPAPLHGSHVFNQSPPSPTPGTTIFLHGPPGPLHSTAPPHFHSTPVPFQGPFVHIGSPPPSRVVSPFPPRGTPLPPPGVSVSFPTSLAPQHHETSVTHFDSSVPHDIIPTTFHPRFQPGLNPTIHVPFPQHASPAPNHFVEIGHHDTLPDSHEDSFRPSVFHPSTFQPNRPIFLSSPLNHPPGPPSLQPISRPIAGPPPLHTIGGPPFAKNLERTPPSFLPGSPGLDREQVLRKKLKKPSRVSRSILKNTISRRQS